MAILLLRKKHLKKTYKRKFGLWKSLNLVAKISIKQFTKPTVCSQRVKRSKCLAKTIHIGEILCLACSFYFGFHSHFSYFHFFTLHLLKRVVHVRGWQAARPLNSPHMGLSRIKYSKASITDAKLKQPCYFSKVTEMFTKLVCYGTQICWLNLLFSFDDEALLYFWVEARWGNKKEIDLSRLSLQIDV